MIEAGGATPTDRVAGAVGDATAPGGRLGDIRVGLGYDAHRFAPGRPLVLGGVRLRESNGLQGHSDADVLVHAVMDALLGAAGLEDIGHYFPDSDPVFAGADSLRLLAEVGTLLWARGWQVINVDAVVICEEPRIAPQRQAMRDRMAAALGVGPDRVGLRGTTTEGMGFTGRGEGIAAQAVALVMRCNPGVPEAGCERSGSAVPEAGDEGHHLDRR